MNLSMNMKLKPILHFLAWTFASLALIYAAVGPHGALWQNPLACIGVGLVGIGLTLEARRRQPALAPIRTRHHEHT